VRAWAQYAYPPSPEGSPSLLDPTSGTRLIPLSQRLRALQNELLALENELADPANPLLQKEREEEHVDPGELIRGLVDVRTRLDKIKKGKEGRARLVSVVVDGDIVSKERASTIPPTGGKDSLSEHNTVARSDVQVMVDIDHRVGELEHVVGSSSASLDEVCYTSFTRKSHNAHLFAPLDFSFTSTTASSHNASEQSAYNSYPTSPYRLYFSQAQNSSF
jgi:nuclear migration protein JNM1